MKTTKTTRKTNQDLLAVENISRQWEVIVKITGGPTPELEKTKYALKKVLKMNKKVLEDYYDGLTDLRIDNAAVDKDGFLVFDKEGEHKFTKDGVKKMNSDIKDLKAQTVKITPHYVEVPKDLDKEVVEVLTGFVFAEEEEKKEETKK